MNRKWILMLAILVVLSSSLSLFAQSSIKIRPILGKHSYSVESTDLGYGVIKHSLCLERLQGSSALIYVPSDLAIYIEGDLFNQPLPSGKLKINSQETADGFLFVANGPQGNNFHLHLKKSSSDNSTYTAEINLPKGNKYSFSVSYLPGKYLLIFGDTSKYNEMIGAISSNQYLLEAISMLDDELANHGESSQLNWWAQTVIGIFQDLVDVESINAIPSLSETRFLTQIIEGSSNEDHSFLRVSWTSGEIVYVQPLFPGQLLIISTSEGNSVSAMFGGHSYLYCLLYKCPAIPGEQDLCIADCMNGGGGGGGADDCESCKTQCLTQYDDDMDKCRLLTGSYYVTCKNEADTKLRDCKIKCAMDYPNCNFVILDPVSPSSPTAPPAPN